MREIVPHTLSCVTVWASTCIPQYPDHWLPEPIHICSTPGCYPHCCYPSQLTIASELSASNQQRIVCATWSFIMSQPYDDVTSPSSPALLFLKSLCALHILLAAALPQVSLLSRSAPIQVPFLLFLSGFALAHTPASGPTLSPYSPQRFYLRRFATLFPIYAIVVILHALIFSTSTHSLLRALFTILLLSPFLPSTLAFSTHDAPLYAQNLIPAMFLCYLLFPVALQVFPRPNAHNRYYLLYTVVGTYFLTVLQALWLTSVPSRMSPRPIFLTDVVAIVPFLTHIPAFLFGVASALTRRAFSPLYPDRSRTILSTRFAVAITTISVIVFFISRCLPSKPDVSHFFSGWVVTGLLLPLLALVTITATDISTATFSTLSLLRSPACQRNLTHTSRLGLTFYLVTPIVHRTLSSMLCLSSVQAMHSPECITLPVPGLSDTMLMEASSRTLSVIPSSLSNVPLAFLFPTSALITIVLYFTLIAPMLSVALQFVDSQVTSSRMASFQASPSSASAPYQSTRSSQLYRNDFPVRNMSKPVIIFRVAAYFVVFIVFCVCAFQLCVPYTLLHSGITHNIARRVLNVLRWFSLLSILPLSANIIGHSLFPRVVWRKLPHISDLIPGGEIDASFEGAERGQLDSSNANVREGPSSLPEHAKDSCVSHRSKLSDSLDLRLYVRYVTRGQNRILVTENAHRAARVFEQCGLPQRMRCIEIVTDQSVGLGEEDESEGIVELVVPENYACSSGALFKARALNYAILTSTARPTDWIIHLDEETRFGADCLQAILAHCVRESTETFVKRSQLWPRIGQGPIVYGKWLAHNGDEESSGGEYGNWITTLADSVRVGDDCGRYRLQFECGEACIGIHGSFVVVCNNVEKEVTFDHGIEGSIAEDAFFAMVARCKGVKFAWIDACMEERSPLGLMDFMKQRARWLVGGALVVWSKKLPFRIRWVLSTLVSIWFMSPVTYTIALMAMLWSGGSKSDPLFANLWSALTVLSLWNYLLGFCVTFSVSELGPIRFVVLLYLQIVLSPLLGIMEMMSVCYAAWNFKKVSTGFHVIQKEVAVQPVHTASPAMICDEKSPLLV